MTTSIRQHDRLKTSQGTSDATQATIYRSRPNTWISPLPKKGALADSVSLKSVKKALILIPVDLGIQKLGKVHSPTLWPLQMVRDWNSVLIVAGILDAFALCTNGIIPPLSALETVLSPRLARENGTLNNSTFVVSHTKVLHLYFLANGPGSAVLVPAPLSFGSFHSALLYFNIHMKNDMAILSLVTYLKKQPESHEPCLFVRLIGSLEADTDFEQADKTYKKPTAEKIPQNRPRSPLFCKLIFTWIRGGWLQFRVHQRSRSEFILSADVDAHIALRGGFRSAAVTGFLRVLRCRAVLLGAEYSVPRYLIPVLSGTNFQGWGVLVFSAPAFYSDIGAVFGGGTEGEDFEKDAEGRVFESLPA
ncbi:hypothetical protein K438DRAFT_1940431 [Mycena galopus ATCC 62051]|nr:hypothetical protein K438DRAFT_1940431 [Mycena galopus ATCC 62051]